MYYFDSLDNIFRFGRYKNQTIEDVLIHNPSYIDFCIREIPSFMISPELVEQIKVYFPNFIIPNRAMKNVIVNQPMRDIMGVGLRM